MLKFLSNSKDWILILLGIILIMFAVFNLIDFNPFTYFESLQESPRSRGGFRAAVHPGHTRPNRFGRNDIDKRLYPGSDRDRKNRVGRPGGRSPYH